VIGVTICVSPFWSQLLRTRRRHKKKDLEKFFQPLETKGENKFPKFVTEKMGFAKWGK